MKQITKTELHSKFDEIIKKASNGEEFIVTEENIPIARILPPKKSMEEIKQTACEILKSQAKHSLSHQEIQTLIKHGRKY